MEARRPRGSIPEETIGMLMFIYLTWEKLSRPSSKENS